MLYLTNLPWHRYANEAEKLNPRITSTKTEWPSGTTELTHALIYPQETFCWFSFSFSFLLVFLVVCFFSFRCSCFSLVLLRQWKCGVVVFKSSGTPPSTGISEEPREGRAPREFRGLAGLRSPLRRVGSWAPSAAVFYPLGQFRDIDSFSPPSP